MYNRDLVMYIRESEENLSLANSLQASESLMTAFDRDSTNMLCVSSSVSSATTVSATAIRTFHCRGVSASSGMSGFDISQQVMQ